jgi:hypothetical protein
MTTHWSDLFIVLYVFIAWCWNLPDDSPGRRIVVPLSRFVQWLGLWHAWNMFAPNPVRESRRLAVQGRIFCMRIIESLQRWCARGR